MNPRQKIKYWLYGCCPGLAGSFLYFGTRVYFTKRSRTFAAVCAQGIFEESIVRTLFALAKPNTTVLDVGANLGLMAVPLLAEHQRVRVVSFEPSPNALHHLQRTHRECAFSDRWTLVPKAVGSQSGSAQFSLSASKEDSLYDGLRPTRRVAVTRQVKVEITTINETWQALGAPPISLIKCDVEGSELDVFRGASECIKTHRPAIVTEWNACNLAAYDCPPESLLQFAEQNSYRLYALPHFARVENPRHLELVMRFVENFVLLPI